MDPRKGGENVTTQGETHSRHESGGPRGLVDVLTRREGVGGAAVVVSDGEEVVVEPARRPCGLAHASWGAPAAGAAVSITARLGCR